MVIGGVRHQFRDTEDGFRARLTVEFPGTMLPSMFAEHGWHLACEFSNWIEAANYGVTPDPVADRLASRGDREP